MHIIELIIVGAIVAGAAFFSGRSLFRSFKGQKATCGCGEASCAYAAKENCNQKRPQC